MCATAARWGLPSACPDCHSRASVGVATRLRSNPLGQGADLRTKTLHSRSNIRAERCYELWVREALMSHLLKLVVGLLVVGAGLCASSRSARAQIHGFVDPCTVANVQDYQTKCELCKPVAGDPKHCEKQLASRGYVFRCRATPGHSEPGEVWCAPKDQETNAVKQWIVTGVATALLAVIFLLTRRGRKRTKSAKRAP